MAALNRTFFFQRVRGELFGGSLSQKQVDGLTTFLDYWDANYADRDDRWLAYVLGTAYHEVDRRMQPIHEYGSNSYFMKYDISVNPKKAKELGNDQVGDGPKYHGRGFVQLTGKRNYRDWENRTGQPLVAQPDLVLDTAIATRIIFEGMVLGTFTGKKLSDYFAPGKADWVNARKIVNGLDQAHNIAGYAQDFYAAISYTV